jgi:glycosyltransferase involved in cell wall biosynthesis
MSAVPVSVVIICKNAAATIRQVVALAIALSNDVVVVDSGSTDDTLTLLQEYHVRVFHQNWLGYGATKNWGNNQAANDWILSLDADEIIDDQLIDAIRRLDFSSEESVYKIKRLNYLKDKPIRHGEWGRDWTIRLFNRHRVQWDNAPVHESLILPPNTIVKSLAGLLHHYTTTDIKAYNLKLEKYADLMAERYFAAGKRGSIAKAYMSSVFNFAKFYFFYGGYLDKGVGWQIAIAHARYTFRKYEMLVALQQKATNVNSKP